MVVTAVTPGLGCTVVPRSVTGGGSIGRRAPEQGVGPFCICGFQAFWSISICPVRSFGRSETIGLSHERQGVGTLIYRGGNHSVGLTSYSVRSGPHRSEVIPHASGPLLWPNAPYRATSVAPVGPHTAGRPGAVAGAQCAGLRRQRPGRAQPVGTAGLRRSGRDHRPAAGAFHRGVARTCLRQHPHGDGCDPHPAHDRCARGHLAAGRYRSRHDPPWPADHRAGLLPACGRCGERLGIPRHRQFLEHGRHGGHRPHGHRQCARYPGGVGGRCGDQWGLFRR